MKLTLTTDDGELLEQWKIDDEQVRRYVAQSDLEKEIPLIAMRRLIESAIPVAEIA